MQLPYAATDSPIASQTIATAQPAGWIWDIGLPTRRGVGYVHSSAHTTEAEAEQVLKEYVAKTAGQQRADALAPRKISFDPGHRKEFWHRNCVAVGISAGFIEPLEASALALIELSAAMIRDEFPKNRELMDVVAKRFNETFRYRWDRVIDFLKLHYITSQREGQAFWTDNRHPGSIPGRLEELMALWRFQPPSRRDVNRIEEIFPSASYQYVLYGMGFVPQAGAVCRKSDDPGLADKLIRENSRITQRMLHGLPSTRELLDHVIEHGMPRS